MKFGMVLIFLFWHSVASAQDFKLDPSTSKAVATFHATVLLINGEAKKISIKSGDAIQLEKGQRLLAGEKIKTLEKSSVKLQLTDDTIIAIGPSSEFEIQKYDFKSKEERSWLFRLIKGQIRALISQKAKPGELTLKTPNIAMGIRGTEFLSNHLQNETQVALLEGALALEHQNNELQLQKGEYFQTTNKETIKRQMTEKEIQETSNSELDEKTQFKSFLQIKLEKKLQELKVLEKQFTNKIKKGLSPSSKKNWRESLKKLNQQIESNQH